VTPRTVSVPEIDISRINLLDRDRYAATGVPHDWFTELRRNAPVAHHPEPDGPGFYVFSRHADVVAIGRDPAHFSSDARLGPNFMLEEPTPEQAALLAVAEGGETLLGMDPPVHTRYRKLVNRGFTPRMIAMLEEKIRIVTAAVVSEAIERGEVDFVVDMAARLPLVVISDLMGIPAADRDLLFRWTNQLMGQDDPEYNSSLEDAMQAGMDMYSYAQELADRARREPTDDIISTLVSADVDGDQLSDMDFNRFFELLILAGNETTRTAIANGMKAFLDHPDQFTRLAHDPTLIDTATAEILRWASPALFFRRNVIEDVDYKGVALRRGDKVSIWFASANRDEDVFDDPFRFDIGRNPNPHVTFGGGGPHYCLGAHLARLELKIFFTELHRRVRNVEALGAPTFLRSNFLAGIKHLPVRLDPN